MKPFFTVLQSNSTKKFIPVFYIWEEKAKAYMTLPDKEYTFDYYDEAMDEAEEHAEFNELKAYKFSKVPYRSLIPTFYNSGETNVIL